MNNLILTAQPFDIIVMPSVSGKQIKHESIKFYFNNEMIIDKQITYSANGLVTEINLSKDIKQIKDYNLSLVNIIPYQITYKTSDNKSWQYQAKYHLSDHDMIVDGESKINNQGIIVQHSRTVLADEEKFDSSDIKIAQNLDDDLATIINKTIPDMTAKTSFRYNDQGQLYSVTNSIQIPYTYIKQVMNYIYNDKNQLKTVIIEPLVDGENEVKEQSDLDNAMILDVTAYNDQGDWMVINSKDKPLKFERTIDYY